jgi:hypothetical protein
MPSLFIGIAFDANQPLFPQKIVGLLEFPNPKDSAANWARAAGQRASDYVTCGRE